MRQADTQILLRNYRNKSKNGRNLFQKDVFANMYCVVYMLEARIYQLKITIKHNETTDYSTHGSVHRLSILFTCLCSSGS